MSSSTSMGESGALPASRTTSFCEGQTDTTRPYIDCADRSDRMALIFSSLFPGIGTRMPFGM